jgi:hypothetical protein
MSADFDIQFAVKHFKFSLIPLVSGQVAVDELYLICAFGLGLPGLSHGIDVLTVVYIEYVRT